MTGLKKEIYWKLEAPFLWDYLNFGIDLRDYNALQIAEAASRQDYKGRKLAFISVFAQMMAGFEDTAGLLLSLKRRFSADPDCPYQNMFTVEETPLFYTMVTFRDSRLDKVLGDITDNKVYDNFHFDKLVPTGLSEPGFLEPDLVRLGLLNMAKFLCEECKTNQTKNDRPLAYNKIKHGAIVLSEGRDVFPEHPSGPAIIMEAPTAEAKHPLQLITFPYSEGEIESMKRAIWLSMVVRKVLLALYLWLGYEEFVRSKEVSHPGGLFDRDMRRAIEYGEPDHK